MIQPVRSRPTSIGWPAWAGLAVIIMAFAIVNARWLYLYRVGQPYDIDETGYLTYALNDFRALSSGGLMGWIRQIEAPSFQAPVTTLLTSLVFAIAPPPSPSFGFAVTGSAGLIAIGAAFAIGREIDSTRTAIATALLVACNPATLNAVRAYHFAMPATAVFLLAVGAMLRSEGFRRLPWSIAFGVFVGLLPLTRTMTIAFLPAIALASLMLALLSGAPRQSLLQLVLAGLAALATMATWLVPNGQYVADYLFSFGYGARSAVYGAELTPSLLDQIIRMLQYLAAYTYLPTLLYCAFGLGLSALALLWDLSRARRSPGRSPAVQRLAILVIVLGSLAALMTSRNKGSAFATPLIPLLIVLATSGVMRMARHRTGSVIAYSLVAAAAAWPAATMIDLASPLGQPKVVAVPILGSVILSSGMGSIQGYESSAGYVSDTPAIPITAPDGKKWLEALRLTAQMLNDHGGAQAVTALGARGYLFNTNEINFVWMFDGHPILPMTQATPEVLGDDVSNYQSFLSSGDAAQACLLLTASGTTGEIQPPITPDHMEAAAKLAGFIAGPHWPLPDGREVTLWQRQHATVPCAAMR